MLDTVQRGIWLGFILDLCAGSFFMPGEKVSRLQSSIASLDLNRKMCALSSIVRQVISESVILAIAQLQG